MNNHHCNLPKVSIIIVNTNELHHLKICLPSIFEQNYPDYEVLIIDNVSTDGSLDFIAQEFPQVRIFKNNKNIGYAGANNVGFNHAVGEYIAVLNPDTRVDKNWLNEIIPVFDEKPSVGLITPKILLMDQPEMINTCGNTITYTSLTYCRGLNKPLDDFKKAGIVSAISGAAFVIRRSVLDEIGGFDDSYFIYYEDTDLSLRAMLAGYDCYFVPSSIVFHKYNFRYNPKKAYLQEKNRYYTLLKIFRWRTLTLLAPSLLFAEITSWIYSFIQGPEHVLSKIKANIWMIRNLRKILTARKDTQKLRKVNDQIILSRLDYRLNFNQTMKPWLARILNKLTTPILFLFSKLTVLAKW